MLTFPHRISYFKKLIENKGKLLTYSVLLDSLWDEGVQITDKHTLAVNINRLRKRLKPRNTLIFQMYMEWVIYGSNDFYNIFSLVFITTFALWKYVRLKHDVYEYTEKLDNTINYMLKNGELKTTPYENDDLWEKFMRSWFVFPICILIKFRDFRRKDKLKELVSDISHQTKTSIANIKLYLEIMTDESDFKKIKNT